MLIRGRVTLPLALAASALLSVPVSAKKVLHWWTHATPSQLELLKGVARDFEASHSDTEVQIQVFSSWNDMWEKLLVSIAAGTPPNVIRLKDYMVKDLSYMGAALRIDQLLARDRKEMEIDAFYESLLAPYRFEGQLFALPWHVYYYMTFYDRTLFHQAGLSGPPETWDDVRTIGRKLTRPQEGLYGTRLLTYSGGDAFFAKTMEMFARQNSPRPLKEPWDVEAELPEFNLVGEAMTGAVRFWVDLINEGIARPYNVNTRTAFWFDSPIGASDLRRSRPDLDFGLALMPRKYGHVTIVEQNAFVGLKDAPYPELTWELMKAATSPETNRKWALDGVYIPLRRKYWSMEPFATHPDYRMAMAQLTHPDTVFHNRYPYGWFDLMIPFSNELANIFQGKKNPVQGLNDAQKAVDQAKKQVVERFYRAQVPR